jgi:hypothetical protein
MAVRVTGLPVMSSRGVTAWVKHHLFKWMKYRSLNQEGADTARRG